VFDKWVVVTSGVDVSFGKDTDAKTTMIMPGDNLTIKATFKYQVTVIDGTAEPAVAAPGATVTIKANAPATSCKAFDKWVANIGTVTLVDSTKTTTTFTMPEGAVKLTATYKDAHTGGTATCLKKAVCEVCKNEYGSLGDHDYAEAWNYKESAGHAHKCELCEAHSTVVAHEYTDKSDASCNTCGYVRILDAVIYTVKFEANGGTGTMESMKVEDGKEYTLPENAFTAPEGKQFKGWKIGETEKKPGDKITVTADVTVTAVWEDIPVVTYTVTFAANGGTGTMEAVKVETGKEYTLPENGFTAPDGKQFKCWKLDDVDLKVGDKITVTSDVTVTAVWEDIPAVTYTVTFDANGGSGTMEAATVEAGKEYELPENKFTAPEGKQFKGWKIGETEKKPGDKITVSADITVTAVWEEIHVCDLKEVAKVEPTCTEPGKEAYYHCDGCNKNFEDKEGTKEIADLDAYGVIEATGHNFVDGVCTKCGAEDPDAATIIRISGSSRYKTAYEIADKLKDVLGVETFDSIVVAYGRGFPDALAGSYLATEKNAPILLVEKNVEKEVIAYIKANLSAKGTVYILGGTSSVPESFANGLKAENIAYKRLAGDNRYLTNLEILKEAELNSKTILVCTGKNFADSLSASAVNLPILLVGDSLTKEQKAYFENIENLTFQIIGGTGSVSESVANELKAFGNVARIAGSTREITSVEVAKAFFKEPEIVTLAYSRDFPDGLCGGPLAYNLGAPLLLVNEGTESYAAEYVKANGIEAGIVFGGTATISDKTAIAVFAK
ncbi:MAG: cell wall-binding repeat-containing protein, partial [Oscillospiraceae bacterium]|nr:cell wall-binding repeat-containing protein [Oscillospiraceae bacterium]